MLFEQGSVVVVVVVVVVQNHRKTTGLVAANSGTVEFLRPVCLSHYYSFPIYRSRSTSCSIRGSVGIALA